MATPNCSGLNSAANPYPAAEQADDDEMSLSAGGYIRFLEILEQGMPPGTRSYLVSVEPGGRRRLSAVPNGASIIDMRNAESIMEHLGGSAPDSPVIARLLEFCLGLSGTSKTVAALEGAVNQMDALSQEAFSEISATARLCLGWLERPDGYDHLEVVAQALSSIWNKALSIEGTVNAVAESVGCNHVDEDGRHRVAAWLKHRQSIRGAA